MLHLCLLQIQRNLQLRIEEQGRYLQMMIEKQCKSGIDLPKGPSSTSESPSMQVAEPVQNSPAKGHLASQGSDRKTEDDLVMSSTEKVVERQKSPQNEVLENLEANVAGTSNSSPPSKRAKRDEQA
jgi:hypothetical protein